MPLGIYQAMRETGKSEKSETFSLKIGSWERKAYSSYSPSQFSSPPYPVDRRSVCKQRYTVTLPPVEMFTWIFFLSWRLPASPQENLVFLHSTFCAAPVTDTIKTIISNICQATW